MVTDLENLLSNVMINHREMAKDVLLIVCQLSQRGPVKEGPQVQKIFAIPNTGMES